MSRQLPIITLPHPHLRRLAEVVPVAKIGSASFQTLIDDLILTMQTNRGVGLAAPQVDHNLRLIIIEHEGALLALINPELTHLSWSKVNSEEGCLSIPKTFGIVRRHRSLRLQALDRTGRVIAARFSGFSAIILQHEVDHLNGVLFVDLKPRRLTTSGTNAI